FPPDRSGSIARCPRPSHGDEREHRSCTWWWHLRTARVPRIPAHRGGPGVVAGFARRGSALTLHDHDRPPAVPGRSEEHTSELQSCRDLVCRLLLEKKKKQIK